MKIKKGLPPGYMPVREDLQQLVNKIHQLSPDDIPELDAFVDYLQKGAEKLEEPEATESKSEKIYEFMNGGFDNETPSSDDESPSEPEPIQ